jgi:hypothetical protein
MNKRHKIHPSRIIHKGTYMHDMLSVSCPIFDPLTKMYQVIFENECGVYVIMYLITEDGDYIYQSHHIEPEEDHIPELTVIEYEDPIEEVQERFETFDTFWGMVEENLPDLTEDPEEI